MPTFKVKAPDGSIIPVNAPDGASEQDAIAFAASTWKPAQSEWDTSAPIDRSAQIPTGQGGGIIENIDAAGKAGLRSVAGNVGRAINSAFTPDPEERAIQSDYLKSQAAQSENVYGGSKVYQAGKLATEIGATWPVGGVLGEAATLARLPRLANALSSSGFTTGAAAPAGFRAGGADLFLRTMGGAATGGASAALVNPDEAGMGAGIGGLLPGALKGVGALGSGLAGLFRPGANAGAQDLARALDAATPEARAAIIAQLRGAETLVPGASPTVAQALQTPQASILQRVVYDSPGANALRDKIVQQGAARNALLESVAPTNAGGFAQSREDLGQSVQRYIVPEEKRLAAQNSLAYQSIDPTGISRLSLPLENMQGSLDKYLGPGTFGQGGLAQAAMSEANRIGTTELPAIGAGPRAVKQQSILEAVKAAGGINQNTVSSKGLSGEVSDLRQAGIGRAVFKNSGLSADDMAMRMHEAGFMPTDDPAELLNLLRNEGRTTFSSHANMDATMQAAVERAAGDMPTGAQSIPRQVPWSELQTLRSNINSAWNKASRDGSTQESAALAAMKKDLDETVMATTLGKGKEGDFMPPAIVARWIEANKSYAAFKDRFRTGPQAGIFRKAGDQQPAKQGGEIASAFWGNRPGLAEDVKSFRRLIDDSPALLGQFQSMVTTQGGATADAAGNLTTKFSKWVKQTLPGLREAFTSDEVDTMQRIAADIDRSATAQKLGTSLGGSNTYQNQANALSLGLLDSPVVGRLASMVPGVRVVASPALEGLRGYARNAKAARLSNLLADNEAAANALAGLNGYQPGAPNALLQSALPYIYRAAPLAVSGR